MSDHCFLNLRIKKIKNKKGSNLISARFLAQLPIHATGCNLENVALSWFTSALETCPIQGLRIKTVKVVSFFNTIKKKWSFWPHILFQNGHRSSCSKKRNCQEGCLFPRKCQNLDNTMMRRRATSLIYPVYQK